MKWRTLLRQLNGQEITILGRCTTTVPYQDGAAGITLYGTWAIPAWNETGGIHYFVSSDNISKAEPPSFVVLISSQWRLVGALYHQRVHGSNDRTIADEAGEYEDWSRDLQLRHRRLFTWGTVYLSDNPDNPTMAVSRYLDTGW